MGFKDVVHRGPSINIGGYLGDIYQSLGGCVANMGGGNEFSYGKYWS